MGDFLPEHFPVPEALAENVAKAYRDGNTKLPAIQWCARAVRSCCEHLS